MKIAGYDPFMSQEKIEALGAEYYADYKELIKNADIVTVHVPLTDQTRNMIGAAELATMKKTALVINCSRGGIVNEEALCEALRAGTIAGAGTDVFCNEPPKPDDPLLNTPNLIVSPHSAAQTREAVIKMATMCVDGCLAVIRGEKWPFVADKKVYDHPRWAGNKKEAQRKRRAGRGKTWTITIRAPGMNTIMCVWHGWKAVENCRSGIPMTFMSDHSRSQGMSITLATRRSVRI